jgi:methionine-rich copper-binding protein CopC
MNGTEAGRRSRTRTIVASFGAVLLASALALVPAISASAHDYLVDSTPKAGSTQTTPITEVKLVFDDIVLNLGGNGSSDLVQVTGPGGRHFEDGCPKIIDRDVTVPVSLGGPGKYTVTWQIVSADGHVVSSFITFNYQPPTGTAEAKGATSRPDCGRQDPNAASTAPEPPGQSGNQATQSGSNLVWVVLIIAGIIVALAIAGVVIILATSRRRRGSSEPDAKPGWKPDDADDE